MSILLVGGDKLGNIVGNLKKTGFDEIKHITGRKKGDRKFDVPSDMDYVLVFTDFIGHSVTRSIKQQCKKKQAKLLFSRRSWTNIEEVIKENIDSMGKIKN